MRALYAVFSGTGNTLRTATLSAERLRALGNEAEVFSIKKGVPMPEIGSFDTLIAAYPVHGFNAPTPILKFLKKLPEGNGMSAYLLRTSGEPSKLNHASGISPKRILKKKGYRVLGEFSYVMPYNIMFRHSDGMAARMWSVAEKMIGEDAVSIANGEGTLIKVDPIRRFAAFAVRIEHPAMPLIGRTFRVTDSCVGCGLCASDCPQGNITMKGDRPSFGTDCVGCMKCAFFCPKDAVRISLLNAWRVNGAYTYDGEPAQDDEVCRYLHKMYVNYFHEHE